MIQNKIQRILSFCMLLAILGSSSVWAQNQFYRYTNAEGNTVLNHMIPPEFVQQGYEILNANGKVIKVVPPAPTKEEVSRKERMQQFEKLYRRFRSAEEINLAKARIIEDIDASIAIVQGNIDSITMQLEEQKMRAASIERQGRDMPENLLKQIQATQMELTVTRDLLATRKADKQKKEAVYDEYVELFNEGLAMKIAELKRQTSH